MNERHAITPEEVLAILRDPDTGPDAPYPCSIGVNCDECWTVVRGDFIVTDRMEKPDRLELARSFLRGQGWTCTEEHDLCPSCAQTYAQEGL